jgi:beta-lactam-binding protein with PASTA domain
VQSNGFRPVARQRRDARIAADVAIETNPPAGTVVLRGTQVEVFISSGR